MRFYTLVSMCIVFCYYTHAQNVTIPDSNLKSALLANSSINTVDDGEISVAEASAYSGSLLLSNLSINDVTGIEAFTNATVLDLSSNTISSIDVTTNIALQEIHVDNTSIMSIDVTQNTDLRVLVVQNTGVSTVDLSNNTLLEEFRANSPGFTSLDVSSNTNLEDLYLTGTGLTSLDLSSNNNLRLINIQNNGSLTSIDLRNGANDDISFAFLSGNTVLTCITVESPAKARATWTNITDDAVYKFTCDPTDAVNIPDATLKTALLNNATINTTDDGEITYAEADAFSGSLNLSNTSLTSATGLEAFVNLDRLYLNNTGISSVQLADFGQLTELFISENNLTELDMTYNALLETVVAENNNLTSLDITNNPSLEIVWMNNNDISTIDLTGAAALTSLYLNNSNLSSIDVSDSPLLNSLLLNNNNLSTIDLSNNPELLWLYLRSNNLSTLDISNNLKLSRLLVDDNSLTTLDLDNHPFLANLFLQNNDLSELSIRNGNNSDISLFNATGNASLSCISVSDPAFAAANWTDIDPGTAFKLSCDPNEIIDIPDATFKAILLADATLNTTDDGEITVGEAEAFTGQINGSGVGISNVIGLEYFSKLTELIIPNNSIDSINVSFNDSLEILNVLRNELTEIDISNNTSLTYVNLVDNEIGSIDVSANTDLETLFIGENQLSSIDVSNNTALVNLGIQDNNISSVDLAGLTSLRVFYVYSNPVNSLDFTDNTQLLNLQVYSTDITSIDITGLTILQQFIATNTDISALDVSNNTKLTDLRLNNCPITALDVTNNPDLARIELNGTDVTDLDFSQNPDLFYVAFAVSYSLNTVNMANGSNASITTFSGTTTPNLTCIKVDNIGYATSNWTNVDDNAIFKLSCDPNEVVSIPDANFKALLLADVSINTTDDGEITYGEAEAYTGNLVANDESIADVTGIEAFKNVSHINMRDNNLTAIDVSNNLAIDYLNLRNNDLTSIDLSYNTALDYLEMEINDLTSLDLTNNSALTQIHLQSNDLTSIDLSNNTLLTIVRLHNNNIASIDLSNNDLISSLHLGGNPITNVDLSQQSNISYLSVSFSDITSLDLSNNSTLFNLNVQGCDGLTSLDLSDNTNLHIFRADNSNNLQSIDLRNGTNDQITSFNTTSTPLLTCISVDDVIYSKDNWTNVDAANEFSFSCDPNENIVFPDANYKAVLLADPTINTIDDGEITVGEAEAFSGTIEAVGEGITDAGGTEYFKNVSGLNVSNNSLSDIDVRYNDQLTSLRIGGNDISSVDVSENDQLTELIITDCPISTIDLSVNTLLETFSAGNNQFTSIDLSNNTAMKTLSIYNQSNLSGIDVSDLVAVTNLSLYGNGLTSIDLSANTALLLLFLENNNLTSLDLSANTALVNAELDNNQLTSLDLTGNTLLQQLDVSNNALTDLNVASGNNTVLTSFNALNNSSLTCITVDDVNFSETNWTNVDASANFSTNCSNIATDILSFSFTEQTGPADIDLTNHEIEIEVSLGTDFTSLTPTFTASAGASSDPLSGISQNFSAAFTYTITSENPSVSQIWTVRVLEENTIPTDITLSEGTLNENNSIDDLVGALATTDENTGDSYTYSLVSGDGDDDNSSFSISGSNLQAAVSFDFETKDSYSIRIQTDDNRGGIFEKQFQITITDINDAPADISLSNNSIQENADEKAFIGLLASEDDDSTDDHTYSLTTGTGDDDNGSFTVSNDSVFSNFSFDFENRDSYSIRILSDDGSGGTFEKQFDISITNENEGILVNNPIDDITLDEGFTSYEVDLSAIFEDLDGDELSLEASSGDAQVVTVNIVDDLLIITEIGKGNTVVSISADDGAGESATDSFDITVNEILNTEAEILSFTFPEQTGDTQIDSENGSIAIQMPYGTDLTSLDPTIVTSTDASITPSGTQDFRDPVDYTVTAEDGTTKDWTVTVTVLPSSANDITSFSITEETGTASIDEETHTINLEVAYGTDITSLEPTFEISEEASVNPISGATMDFSNPVEFTVTAQDGTTQVWVVTVTVALNNETEVISFSIDEQVGSTTINSDDHTINLEVPFGTQVSSLSPVITLSDQASVSPNSEVAQDFTNEVVYTVTAGNGDTQLWTATVDVQPNAEAEIISFEINGQLNSEKNEEANRILITMPMGTDPSSLNASARISTNATISPSLDNPIDFTTPVTFTVTAENGKVEEWEVAVEVEQRVLSVMHDFQVEVFPNPVVESLTISSDQQNSQVLLYTISGELVLDRDISSGTHRIDFSMMSAGNYLIKILNRQGNIIYNNKLIKR